MSEEVGTLVLHRAIGQEVVIGPVGAPLCRVRVVRVQPSGVRLAFEAPHNVEINRGEIADLKLAREFGAARDVEVRDERMALTKTEIEKRTLLLDMMHARGESVYEHGDLRIEIAINEKVKVKIGDDEEDGDEDGDD